MFDWLWRFLGLDIEINENDRLVSVRGGIF